MLLSWILKIRRLSRPCILPFVFGPVCIYISGTIFYPSEALLGHYSFTMNLYDQHHVEGFFIDCTALDMNEILTGISASQRNTIIE